jgi:hypothetical protein
MQRKKFTNGCEQWGCAYDRDIATSPDIIPPVSPRTGSNANSRPTAQSWSKHTWVSKSTASVHIPTVVKVAGKQMCSANRKQSQKNCYPHGKTWLFESNLHHKLTSVAELSESNRLTPKKNVNKK